MRWALAAVLLVTACKPALDPGDERTPYTGTIELIERYTGGAKAGETLPLVVALHGLGASPENIIGLLDGLAVPARVIALRGITRTATGWGWFAAHFEGGLEALAPGIGRAADAIARLIAQETKAHPTCGLPIVVGFSQGGMLSYALAGRAPPVVAAAFPVAGLLPSSLYPAAGGAGPRPPVIAFHGNADARVSIASDREANARFAQAGHRAELKEYANVKHAISAEMERDIVAAITEAIRTAGCGPR